MELLQKLFPYGISHAEQKPDIFLSINSLPASVVCW